MAPHSSARIAVVGEVAPNGLDDERLRAAVHLGDEVDRAALVARPPECRRGGRGGARRRGWPRRRPPLERTRSSRTERSTPRGRHGAQRSSRRDAPSAGFAGATLHGGGSEGAVEAPFDLTTTGALPQSDAGHAERVEAAAGDDPAHARPSPAHGPASARARRRARLPPSERREPAHLSVMRYDGSEVVERDGVTLDECIALLDQPGITWINVDGLGEPEVMARLGERLHFHPLALEDVFNVPQRPKVEALRRPLPGHAQDAPAGARRRRGTGEHLLRGLLRRHRAGAAGRRRVRGRAPPHPHGPGPAPDRRRGLPRLPAHRLGRGRLLPGPREPGRAAGRARGRVHHAARAASSSRTSRAFAETC